MVDYKELRQIINGSKMSIKKYQNGQTVVKDSNTFHGMSISALKEAQELIEKSLRADVKELADKSGIKQIDTLKTVTERANRNINGIIDCMASPKAMSAREAHQVNIRDSVLNGRWNISNGADPSISNIALPNIYISPWEANSLYSQKGLFETIINKKSKSILLNGISLINSRLSAEQLDKVKERMEILNFKNVITESVLNSLVYGGSLTFPMFKKDTPATTNLKLSTLVKLGVVGKNCIDYFVTLDRWQTLIIPPYNPTQKDFMNPEVYTIPFLGSDVHNGRVARVVTAKQAGYWGQVINQGWGISDLCGYVQSGMNYKVAIQSLPLMIQQMSILARTINVDGVLATEGGNALDALVEANTIRMREISADNPINMDVLGDLKCINRNFAQVPELIKLLRQDLASDAIIPEPMLFSSDKGNFSSGDDTQGNLAKQYESVKMIHKEIEPAFKQLVKIIIIDTLGADKEIIEALPYTQIHFDEPVIANAVERAQIGKFFSETVFNFVSAQIPADISVEMAQKNISSDLAVSNEVLERLRDIQAKNDKNDKARTELEIENKALVNEQLEQNMQLAAENAENEAENAQNNAPKGKETKSESTFGDKKGSANKALKDKQKKLEGDEEKKYTRLEQKQHEKTRVGSTKRSEKLAKTQKKIAKVNSEEEE